MKRVYATLRFFGKTSPRFILYSAHTSVGTNSFWRPSLFLSFELLFCGEQGIISPFGPCKHSAREEEACALKEELKAQDDVSTRLGITMHDLSRASVQLEETRRLLTFLMV